VQRALKRTVPVTLVVNTIAIYCYTTTGNDPDDVEAAHAIAPWCRDNSHPSVSDMFAKLCRVIIPAASPG